ncbi:MAG: prepilin-type N-terminal cleavage/methylation domain-containing protein [Rhodoferax sp.]
MPRAKDRQRGFTLSEMAIVIVLGGILLAAGLMAGRGQISRAQAQDIIQTVKDLQGAAMAFKQRYGYLPGDLPAPNTVLNGATAGTGGTLGNGLVQGALSGAGIATAGTEIAEAPRQLFLAGLIGKIGTSNTNYVNSAFGPAQIAQATGARTSAAYVAAFPTVSNVILLYNLPCEVVSEVDLALDDGGFQTGRSQASGAACTAGNVVARYWVPL